MKIEEAKKAVKRLLAAYPNWKPDKDILEIWVEEFMDTEDERVTFNIKDWLKRGEKFMPSLAEMIAPHPRLEADKEKERTRQMLNEREERKKNAVPAPWTKEGITWQEWYDRLPKASDKQ